MARKRLGEILLERRVVTREQLEQALAYQRQTGHRLGSALVALGFLSETQLCDALGQALGLKAVRMPPDEIDWTALHSLRPRFCEANDLFPLTIDTANPSRKAMIVAMADPLNLPAVEEMEFTTGMKVTPVIAPLSGIRAAIRRYYQKQADPAAMKGHGPGEMTIVRPGGAEEKVQTGSVPVQPRPAPPPTDDDLPLVEGEPVGEVTARTALADLIRQRAEKRKQKKKSVDADLAYLFGAQGGSPGEQVERLERKLWALLRILAKKGLITRDEFMTELSDEE